MRTAPTTHTNDQTTQLKARIDRARNRARRVLWLESIWPTIQVPLGLVGAYALAGLVRLPQYLPDTIHAFLLAGIGGGVLTLSVRNLKRLQPPELRAIDRRIEQRSNLPHHPLTALEDRPADGRKTAVWRFHMAILQASISTLRVGWPRLSWTTGRKIGWITFSSAFLFALTVTGSAALSRLESAFLPGTDDSDVPLPRVEAWVDLPEYAHGAPIFLSHQTSPPPIPQDAHLTIHVTGAKSRPHLRGVDTDSSGTRQLDPESWLFSSSLSHSGLISMRSRGRTIAEWYFKIEPDLPPKITWKSPPTVAEGSTDLVIPWQATQPHGLASLEANIRLNAGPDLPAIKLRIPLKGLPHEAEGDFQTDLTESLWAGEAVTIRLHVESRSGRDATSSPKAMILPSRTFHDPAARALIDLRHRFGLNRETSAQTSEELKALAETLPLSEKGSTLSLLYAAAQLDDLNAEHAREDALGLCWTVALYLEDLHDTDQETARANLDTRAAQKALQELIAHMHGRGSTAQSEAEQEELAASMKTLRNALSRRMQALVRRSMQLGTIIPDLGEAPLNGTDPVSRLMRRLQSDAARGDTDQALQRLADLSKMTERMRQATPQDLAQIARQLEAQARALEQRATIHDLIRRETALLDHVQARISVRLRLAREAQHNETDLGSADEDINTMTTTELLRRLGMTPHTNMDETPLPASAITPTSLTAEVTASQHEQRRVDHSVQRALRMVAKLLNDDIESLTEKPMDGLGHAKDDMKSAQSALANADDRSAEFAIRRVLKDLAETGTEMSEASKGKSHGTGAINLLPVMAKPDHVKGGKEYKDQDQTNGEDEDSDSTEAGKADRDPLGRTAGEGHSGAETDGLVPDTDSRAKAREIERELRRRDADRTRPRRELDYLDRLLKAY